MAIEYWYPVSVAEHDLPAGYNDWAVVGANKNIATTVSGGRSGPVVHDDTSYIQSPNATAEQSLNVSWPGPMTTVGGVFNINGRHRALSGTPRRVGFLSNAAGTLSTSWMDVTNAGAVFADTGPVDISNAAVYRPGGGAWVTSDFVNDQTIFPTFQTVGAVGEALVSSVWGQIEYVPQAGGFVFLLGLAALAAPIAGVMDAAHFAHFLAWRRVSHPRHTILTSGEVLTAWREVRAYRHPRFFLPAVA